LLYMMSAGTSIEALAPRLARLTGEDADCCVPEYEGLAERLSSTARFRRELAQHRLLADSNRLLSIALLRDRDELCGCEIQAALGVTHATVSHHMGLLESAGLVRTERRGKWTFYRLTARAKEAPR
jgi:DNA-binding transcriptional ArsR family regulator